MLFILIACGIIYLVSWKSPQYYTPSTEYNPNTDSIIPFENYSKLINHPRPYIVAEKDKYTIFGSAHTRDPKYFEIELIEKEWKKLKPTVALVEGRLGFLIPGIMDPVKHLGEGGKVKSLAKKDNVPVYNWDLPKEKLATSLLIKFNAEQIALSQILNPYFGELKYGKPDLPEKYVEKYLKRASYVGQENNIKTVKDIDSLWEKYFPPGENWRNINDQNGLPGFLDDIAVFTNDLRNQQLVVTIKELLAKGKKVFVICGSSHAVCVSTAFKVPLVK